MEERISARVGYCNPGDVREDREAIFDFFTKIFTEFLEVNVGEILEECRNDTPQHRCDLVVVDCRDLSRESFARSVELLESLKRRDERIKQLILYRKGELAQLSSLMDKGARCFFPVPWDVEAIRYVLRPLLELMTLPGRLRRCQGALHACRSSLERDREERVGRLEARLATEEGFVRRQLNEMERSLRELVNMHTLILQDTSEDGIRSHLGRAERAAAFLGERIEEIRGYFDGIEDSGISRQTFNLNHVLSGSSERIGPEFEAAKMELVFEQEHNVPAKITGDPVQLGQILVSLFEILAELDRAGDLILHLSLESPEGSEEGLLRFRMTRERIKAGSEEWKERLERHPGIREARRRIEELGGGLELGTGEEGTVLSFTIPVRKTERRSYRLPSREWMGKRILIVDAHEASARALAGMLGYFRFHRVDRVASPEEGTQRLYEERYDIIFVHENLFDAFADEALSIRRDAHLVLMTRHREKWGRQRTHEAPVEALLPLPFTQQDVFDVLLELYSGERMEDLQETLAILRENLTFLLGGKTALYIGPEDSDLLNVQNLLEGARIVTVRIEEPEQAEALLDKVDLVILHDAYPDAVRKRLLALCREQCSTVPVFALSEGRSAEEIMELKRAGVDHSLPLPLDPERFYRMVLDTMLERGKV